ncbi:hypothetical protein F5B22DRAFT_646839 [Xylaria bambusicola]|uniref:uncharacterized protein n=1 Tax=Xylaria bambusicola TaxID=326684 RepID=UPI0020088304|nr:uncharacterized protein F5B22DRAFT_646839 [Xylaria bambusicola]KAI0515263.1 hypothetical protein F5B22DRAFT_646839 [Xylaria bambusicola]
MRGLYFKAILDGYMVAYEFITDPVTNNCWLLAKDVSVATSADWLAAADDAQFSHDSVPGIIQLKCMETRSEKHYDFTCSRTKGGCYQNHQVPPEEDVIHIDGEVLQEGTEGHTIISRAFRMIEANLFASTQPM